MLHKIFIYSISSVLAFSLSFIDCTATAADSSEVEGLNRYIDSVEDVRRLVDRSQFDTEALVDRLDWQADEIVRFVRREINYEQYLGLLRGPAGTLRSRAGNALDQSVLLAKLLKDAGYEARIQRHRLTPEQATRLLRQMRPKPPYPPAGDPKAFASALRALGAVSAKQPGPRTEKGWQQPSEARIDAALDSLLSTLSAADITLGDPQSEEQLNEEAQDYFWVELRRAAAADWSALHPVFINAKDAFVDLPADQTFTDTIPSELHYRLRFQAFIEQKVGQELKVHAIMDAWERPVANLAGHTISFANVPSQGNESQNPQDRNAALDASKLFVPFFNGKLAPGGRAFDLNGIPFALESLEMDTVGATPLFQEIGGKFGKASGLLSWADSEDSDTFAEAQLALTAEWVEYTVIAPDGSKNVYRRTIFDRLGPDARTRSDFSTLDTETPYRELLAAHGFRIATGHQAPALLWDEMLAEMLREAEHELKNESETTSLAETLALYNNELFLLGLFDRLGAHDKNLLFRSGPLVLSIQSGYTRDNTAYVYGDIVQSPWRAFDLESAAPIPAPEVVMRQGIWETATEDYLLALLGAERPASVGAQGSVKWRGRVVLKPGTSSIDPDSRLDDDARQLVRQALDQGFVAVIGRETADSPLNPDMTWWRINPRTGGTLGIGAQGKGPAATESLLKIKLVAIGVGAGLAVGVECYYEACDYWHKCMKAYDPHCCEQRFKYDRRKELQKSLPGTLLIDYMEGSMALFGLGPPIDPACL